MSQDRRTSTVGPWNSTRSLVTNGSGLQTSKSSAALRQRIDLLRWVNVRVVQTPGCRRFSKLDCMHNGNRLEILLLFALLVWIRIRLVFAEPATPKPQAKLRNSSALDFGSSGLKGTAPHSALLYRVLNNYQHNCGGS